MNRGRPKTMPEIPGSVTPATLGGDEPGRSVRKQRAILDAALGLFLRHGYLGTSMDDVAAAAKVSKQTVYKHFGDKRRMFVELLTGCMAGADATVAALAEAVPDSQDLETDLRAFARAYLAAVMAPHLIRLRRVVIGEAERFPELAAAWYTSGPAQAYTTFAHWFETLDQRGLLRADDPVLAAQHFNWLILSIPLNEAMARPIDDSSLAEGDLDRYADEGVRVFLAAYGAPRHTS
ncbi:MAG: TetR/AcrR family transcriptional regulator [Pseudonocardia sp.]|nr:TetR/AcrR family transcriptional regulator [Pseudonocardia sp.]